MNILYVIIGVVLLAGGWFYYADTSGPDQSADVLIEDESDTDADTTPADTSTAADDVEDESSDESPTELEDETVDTEPEDDATESTDTTEHVFDVSGFNYGFSEEEMRVQAGDTVTINFTSSEGLHDWVLDEFDAATGKVGAGQSDSITFVASETGTFEYYCSVGQHRQHGMVGTLIVE